MSTNTKLAEALRKGRGLLPDASLMSDDELAWDLEAAAVLAEFDAAKGEAMNNDPDWLNNQSFRDQAAYEALAAHDAEQAQAAKAVPAGVIQTIVSLLEDAMSEAISNGANSISMPDEYVELAVWIREVAPTPPAPEAKSCLITGTCKHGSWCSEVYCQEHCQFVEAQAAPEAQQAAQVGALPEPLTDDDAYRIVCEFFNQPWYRRVATEVVRATEKAHGIGATTGKEPGNV